MAKGKVTIKYKAGEKSKNSEAHSVNKNGITVIFVVYIFFNFRFIF